jgi:integrase/recombinase XerD
MGELRAAVKHGQSENSAAMPLLQNLVDCAVIALWLGHESVESTPIYAHADIQIKEQ